MITPEMVANLVSSILEKKGRFHPQEFLTDGLKEFLPGGYVQVYRTEMDQWGVKFLPLVPRYLEIDQIMAGVYREVGRKLMCPAYRIHPQNLIHEFSSFYRGMTLEAREKMAEIIRKLAIFQSLCEKGAKNASLLSASDVEEKIGEILGPLEILVPLYGFFSRLKEWFGN